MTGDKFDINVVDLWSSSSPWPLCNMPKSYFFLVKHPWLWRMSFRCSEPELLHEAMFTVRDPSHCHSLSLHVLALCVHVLLATYFFNGWILTQLFASRQHSQGYTAIVGRRFAQAFQEYTPNLIVSVHPLMQHVPVSLKGESGVRYVVFLPHC